MTKVTAQARHKQSSIIRPRHSTAYIDVARCYRQSSVVCELRSGLSLFSPDRLTGLSVSLSGALVSRAKTGLLSSYSNFFYALRLCRTAYLMLLLYPAFVRILL